MHRSEPIHDVARGDVGVSRQLSAAFRVLMETTSDPQLKRQVRNVLEGKGSARELMHTEAFNRVLDRTLPSAMRQFAEMPEGERRRLAEQGEAELRRLRAETVPVPPQAPAAAVPAPGFVVPGTRRPDRERIVAPDDDDADDEYFRDRRRRGWLQ